MQELLKATREERAKYFHEATARSKNIKNIIIIEKDFWVCWVMNQHKITSAIKQNFCN